MFKLRDGREVEVNEWIEGVEYNVYDCGGGIFGDAHPLLSMDVDKGVTPFLKLCPDHDMHATSRFYRVDALHHPSLFPVRFVWRRATSSELKREKREGGDYYRQGGLAVEVVS